MAGMRSDMEDQICKAAALSRPHLQPAGEQERGICGGANSLPQDTTTITALPIRASQAPQAAVAAAAGSWRAAIAPWFLQAVAAPPTSRGRCPGDDVSVSGINGEKKKRGGTGRLRGLAASRTVHGAYGSGLASSIATLFP